MFIGGLGAALFAAVIGYPALRVRGVHFAVLTLAVWGAVRQVLLLNPLELTGGTRQFPHGYERLESINFLGVMVDFANRIPNYYLALILLLVTLLVMYRLDTSRLGLILRSMSQSESLAQSVGVNTVRYKVFVFVMSSFLAGVAGAFYSHYLQFADPNLWGLWQAVYLVIYVILGGAKYLLGPVVGSFALIVLVELIQSTPLYRVLPDGQALAILAIIYAIVMLLMIFLLPGGILSLGEVVKNRFGRFRRVAQLQKDT
jgi:branched-chain amino acid transport system permease protein